MSKTVSGQDMEDMLSSVRRLVSNELPRAMRTSRTEPADALVLTPAQRIEPPKLGHNSRRKSLEDRIAELEAAVSNKADEWEPDGSEDQAQHIPDRIVFKRSEPDEATSRRRSLRLSEIALIETGPANEPEDQIVDEAPASFRHEVPEHEEPRHQAQILHLGTPTSRPARGDDSSVQEDDETPGDAFEGAISTAATSQIAGIVEAEIEAATPVVEAVEPAEDIETVEDQEADRVLGDDEDFDAALAAAVGGVTIDLPDAEEGPAAEDITIEPVTGDELPETVAVAVEVEVEVEVELPTEPVAETSVPVPPVTLDAADLRPLVAALIRDELQGELGERITRNVRKLVRQEIQRALAVRDLE